MFGQRNYGFMSLGWNCQLFCIFGGCKSILLAYWSSFVASDYLIGVGFGSRVLCTLPRAAYWSSFVASDYLIGVSFGSRVLCVLPRVE